MKSIFSVLIKIRDRLSMKKVEDEYLTWLRFANAGMLNPGNVYAMKYAIENLPTSDPIIEIGSFCGLSTNVLSYFLRKNQRKNIIFCSDKWIFEGSEESVNLGLSDISHADYRPYVKETFMRNINFFSPNRPHPIELFSDEFFEKWKTQKKVVDVFNQSITLGGNISFSYIDGNHTYEFAKRDFENVNQHLVPGGFILFDDSSDSDPFGLTKLMREIKQRSDYSLVMKNPNYLFQKN